MHIFYSPDGLNWQSKYVIIHMYNKRRSQMEAVATPLAGKPLFSNKALKKLIFPLVIEQFLAISVGFCDTVMISGLGDEAISGVSLVDMIMTLMINVFAALATGGAVHRRKKSKGRAQQRVSADICRVYNLDCTHGTDPCFQGSAAQALF